jgi:hypothetical protein
MAKNESTRLKPSILQADEDGFAALQNITGYAPANPTYAIAVITAAQTALEEARDAEAQAEAAAATARDRAVAREWGFHNLMLGVKDQVIAQFGKDSNEVQAVGLKRKSEYKSPSRGPKTSGASK